MKKLLLISLLLIFTTSISACSKKQESSNDVPQEKTTAAKNTEDLEQEVLNTTLTASKEYMKLRVMTDRILTRADQYPDYETWNQSMTNLLAEWSELEKTAAKLETLATDYAGEEVSFHFINKAHAATNAQINDVFSKAPAGKKIKTLAQFLGVDAKRAFKILQQTQNEVTADAYNEAGDTFRNLEVGATVIKDGAKVGGFVVGFVASGGTAGFVASGAVAQTAVVVTGADLVLEVSEDGANMGLGDGNGVSEMVGNVRKFTEPGAAILSIASTPDKLVTNLDKANAWLFGADQLRSVVQDGKVIGIALPKYEAGKDNKDINVTVVDLDKIDEWLAEQDYEPYEADIEELLGIFDEYTSEDAVTVEDSISLDEDEEDTPSSEKTAVTDAPVIIPETPKVEENIGTKTNSGFTVDKTACSFDGNWSTNWGDMKLSGGSGSYTHDSGKISGTVNGNILIGRWSEAPSYSGPKDAGDVELKLSSNCNSFSGNWRYGSSGSWSGGWTGTRK